MKILMATIAAISLMPGLVLAQAVGGPPTPGIIDKNSDGAYDLVETRATFSNVTQADMDKADTDGDGKVTAKEMMRAVSDGVLK